MEEEQTQFIIGGPRGLSRLGGGTSILTSPQSQLSLVYTRFTHLSYQYWMFAESSWGEENTLQ